jgi:hypothetical protein
MGVGGRGGRSGVRRRVRMGSFRELSGSSGCGFNGLGLGDGFVWRIFPATRHGGLCGTCARIGPDRGGRRSNYCSSWRRAGNCDSGQWWLRYGDFHGFVQADGEEAAFERGTAEERQQGESDALARVREVGDEGGDSMRMPAKLAGAKTCLRAFRVERALPSAFPSAVR